MGSAELMGIWTRGLRREFRRGNRVTVAVADVDLTVRQGEVFGMIGPNGAGKSTLIALLCTLVEPTAGEGKVAGFDLRRERRAVRESIGLNFGGERGFYWRLTLQQNMDFFAAINLMPMAQRKKRVQEVLEAVDLWDRRHTRFGEASTGMKRRLNFARAILFDRPVYLCDEPTTGVDPESAKRIQDILAELRAKGRTIVLVTHNLDEVDRLADRVAMMVGGRIRFLGSPAELRRLIAPRQIAIALSPAADEQQWSALRAQMRSLNGFHNPERRGDRLVLECDNPEAKLPHVLAAVGADGLPVEGAWVVRPSLQDVFLKLVEEG